MAETQSHSQLSQAQIDELRDAFSLFDKDGDGTISGNELGTVLRSIGKEPSEAELQEMVRMADVDGDGCIDFPEFITVMSKKLSRSDPDREIKEAWHIFSCGNDYIQEKMIAKVMGNLGENLNDDQVAELVAEADHDGDGRIGYEDFYKTMKADSS